MDNQNCLANGAEGSSDNKDEWNLSKAGVVMESFQEEETQMNFEESS